MQIDSKLEVSPKILAEFIFSKKFSKSFYISFKNNISYFMAVSIICWVFGFSLTIVGHEGSDVMIFFWMFFSIIAIFLLIPFFLCIHYELFILLLGDFDLLFLMGNLIVFMVAGYWIAIEVGWTQWTYTVFNLWIFLFMTFVNFLDCVSFSVTLVVFLKMKHSFCKLTKLFNAAKAEKFVS